MNWKLKVSYLIVIILIIVGCCLLYDKKEPKLIIEQSQLQLLTDVECGVYETTSEFNVLTCDIATVSYLVQQMQEDDYVLEQIQADMTAMDIYIGKGTDMYRLHYIKEGTLISICNVYEKSFMPFTYINEE